MKKDLLFYFIWILSLMAWGVDANAQYAVNGSASQNGNCFVLTPDLLGQSGSVWYLNKVDISQAFELDFNAFFGCKDFNGADGIAFVLQQVSTNVGSAGGGIGYFGISPSLAVEFDTYYNSDINDPNWDHVAITKNGVIDHNTASNLAGPVPILSTYGNVEDCTWHDLKITWNPDSTKLSVYVNCELRLSYTGNIISNIFNGDSEVFWGFTSATGGLSNRHEFCFDFVSFVENLKDTTICKGGSASLDAVSGDIFTWTPATGLSATNIANPIASPDTTTTYYLEVIDNCNDLRYDTVTVYVVDTINDVLEDNYRLCPNGEVLIIPDYPLGSYQWHTGQVADTLIATQPGTFVVQVSSLCSNFPDTFTVLPALLPDLIIDDVLCFGQTSGNAALSLPFPSQDPILWGNTQGTTLQVTPAGSSNDQLGGLGAGNYFYLTRDSAGCVLADSFAISEPADLQLVNPITFDIQCGGQSTGQLSATAIGGVPPYLFSLNGRPFQSNPGYSNLNAGNHILTVRDSNQCEQSLTITLTENPPLSIVLDSTTANPCFGDSLGRVFVSANGGVGSLEFAIDQGPFQNLPSFENLSAGNHTVQVRDSLGCTSSLQVSVSQPSQLDPGIGFQRNIDCFANNSGELRLQAQGGTAPYSFSFGNGSFASNDSFTNLTAGFYPFAVMDDNGCLAQDTLEITQPPLLEASIAQIIDVACFGDSTGAVTLRATGGAGNYQFGLIGNNPGPDSLIHGLALGTYTFIVADDSACTDTIQAFVDQPTPLQASISNLLGVDCLGNQSGGMDIQGSGGSPPYTFAIINSGNVSTGFGSNPQFDSLFAGIYTAQVMDANGCLAQRDTFIPTPTNLVGGIDTLIDVDCFGRSSGSILMSASGGRPLINTALMGSTLLPDPCSGASHKERIRSS